MSYTVDQLSGLLATTHTRYPKQELTVTWNDSRFEAARILNTENIKKQGGTSITGKALLSPTGNARWVDYYEKDQLGQGETLHEFTMPWKRFTTNWSWDEFEILQNKSDPEGFIDLAKVKECQAMWDLANLFETSFWKTPTSASSKEMRGLQYYIRMMDKETTTDGWVGKTIRYQNGDVSTVCAGIDASVYSQWCNWAALYTAVNSALIKTLRTAFMRSGFKAPLGANQFEVRKAAKRRVYTGYDVKAGLFDYLDAKDDVHATKETFGRMVVTEGTDMLINGHDVIAIDDLAAMTDVETGDTASPIYCVDFAHFVPVVYSGYWMKVTGPVHGGTIQHTTWTMFKDGACNCWSDNPRAAGFVVHKALTAA
ncbi:hypothetical protein IMZ48_26270 [Candidatus Bathyarchaeota archaeon]|nr:hypothetical protein [Candidatus Bathyarchaeota archaeon]